MAVLFDPPSWAFSANIYEVNLRQYTREGTIRAFMAHLPRLADMGVQVLWLMPVTPIAVEGRKGTLGSYYASKAFRALNPEFGTLDDFRALVERVHELGMKIIIDWVANHTGLDHEWTRSNPDFYLRDATGNFTEKNGWDDVIDLDYTNPALEEEMIACMEWWLQSFGIDGFRCDMAHLVPLSFWQKARTKLDVQQKHFWLAECEESRYHDVFDVTYTWEWMHASERFAKQQASMQDLWELLYKLDHRFPSVAMRAYFTTNHDENSWNGTEYEKFGGLALPLAVFSATWNGMPLLYSGQEMPNIKRLKFFDKDEIEWNERPALHDFYKKLFHLRAVHAALRAGDTNVYAQRIPTSHPLQVFCFIRENQGARVLIMLNFSASTVSFSLNTEIASGQFTELFGNNEVVLESNTSITLPPYGYYVFHQ